MSFLFKNLPSTIRLVDLAGTDSGSHVKRWRVCFFDWLSQETTLMPIIASRSPWTNSGVWDWGVICLIWIAVVIVDGWQTIICPQKEQCCSLSIFLPPTLRLYIWNVRDTSDGLLRELVYHSNHSFIGNAIGPEGTLAIAEALPASHLRYLCLDGACPFHLVLPHGLGYRQSHWFNWNISHCKSPSFLSTHWSFIKEYDWSTMWLLSCVQCV